MRRLIIGITGASGAIYGLRAFEMLRDFDDIEAHPVISPAAVRTALVEETGKTAVGETPLHAGHIALMDQATRNGAVIMPPVRSFYTLPKSIAEMVDQTVGHALDQFGIHHPTVRRWTEDQND